MEAKSTVKRTMRFVRKLKKEGNPEMNLLVNLRKLERWLKRSGSLHGIHLPEEVEAENRRRAVNAAIVAIGDYMSAHGTAESVIHDLQQELERRFKKAGKEDDPESAVFATPAERQADVQLRLGYGPVHLERQGDYAVVSLHIDGKWVEVIREHYDDNFCHTIEPLGILDRVQGNARKNRGEKPL